MTGKPTHTQEWRALQTHTATARTLSLQDLFAKDPERKTRTTLSLDGLTVDFSRNHLTDETVALLVKLAQAQKLEDWRTRMFSGEKINTTENRAVLHTALRGKKVVPLPLREGLGEGCNDSGEAFNIFIDGHDITKDIRALHARMEKFVDDVRQGRWLGLTGKPIRHVVNIGIGGSDLGPRLVASALRDFIGDIRPYFVANADAADLLSVLEQVDPETTLFVVVSKAFTTQETLLNAQTARQWLQDRLGEGAAARHFVAVSSNEAAVTAFGINPANIFPMWDWVGGRYSLWSSVGLSVAVALGWENFHALLDGAATMDAHFRTAPLERNLPVLLGLVALWYRNFWGTSCHAVMPYSERLREFPRFLQQLEMESNGKSVTRDGEAVDYATAPALFGECGTVGQHSFHQWFHQGTDLTPVDFIGVRNSSDKDAPPRHHEILLANLVAQAEALRLGRKEPEAYRSNAGNKPSTILWLDRLDPFRLGLLIALYEHKTFVQGIIWNINSFDQFGVELGKKLAASSLVATSS